MLLPDPETPEIVTSLFNGISTLKFFRLFSLHPEILILDFESRIPFDSLILIFPFKYFAVRESELRIFLKLPSATTCPPKVPALGPMSII